MVPPRYHAPCSATLARSPPSSRSMPGKRLKPNRLASVNSRSRLSSFGYLLIWLSPACGATSNLRHRLDELRAPCAGIPHERPAEIHRRLRQRARRVDMAERAEIRLLIEAAGIVANGIVVQRALVHRSPSAPTNGRSQFSVRLARRVLVPTVRTTLKAPASMLSRPPQASGCTEIAVPVARQDQRQLVAGDRRHSASGRI